MNSVITQTTADTRDEQGKLLFTVALQNFVETMSPTERSSFESWIDEHNEDEDIFAHLLQKYPRFGDIFTDEIEKFGQSKR